MNNLDLIKKHMESKLYKFWAKENPQKAKEIEDIVNKIKIK